MTGFALALVLSSAICHASWNLLAKKVCGGTAFIWLFASLSALLYFPVAFWILLTKNPVIGTVQLELIFASAVLHALYFVLLDKGYQIGDFSVIYPLARGTGPLLSILTAILLLGERPSLTALTGALFIGAGIVVITGNPFAAKDSAARRSILYALLCGVTIASYTVVDKIAVSAWLLPPLLMDWCTNLGRIFLLTPYALRNWGKVKEQWTLNKKEAFGVAFLSPLSYILVLTAMVFSPVSYIAPAREISILFGAVIGAKIFAEGDVGLRACGAATMLIGLVALSIG